MTKSFEMNDKNIRNGPDSKFLDNFPLLVALWTKECIIFSKSLFACVQAKNKNFFYFYSKSF